MTTRNWEVRKNGEKKWRLSISLRIGNDSFGNIDWFVHKYPKGFGEIRGYPEHAVISWLYTNKYEYREI